MRRLSLTTLNHQNNSQGTMKRSLKSILTIALQPGSEQQVGLVQRPELLQETLHGPRFIWDAPGVRVGQRLHRQKREYQIGRKSFYTRSWFLLKRCRFSGRLDASATLMGATSLSSSQSWSTAGSGPQIRSLQSCQYGTCFGLWHFLSVGWVLLFFKKGLWLRDGFVASISDNFETLKLCFALYIQVKMPPTNGNQFHDWSHTGG